MKFLLPRKLLLVPSILFMMLLASCYSTKKSAYFHDLNDTTANAVMHVPSSTSELTIQPDDILNITVQSSVPELASPFNQGNQVEVGLNRQNPSQGGYMSLPSNEILAKGYLVDAEGNIALPQIGTIKVAGLTTYALRNLLTKKISVYVKDALVQVRLLNYKVNVMGEVNRPGTYVIPNEKLTVLDAISMAGDLTIYAKRNNILVVREQNGQKSYGRLNINSSTIFSSPYYYLHQNDVVYVEPNKNKVAASDAITTRWLSFSSLALGVATLIATLTR